ncbi:MAG: hypothetical protein J6B01_13005, partial [Ruminococcus sp.]|nr:hypothetical protein [Ruminococcus sp.]
QIWGLSFRCAFFQINTIGSMLAYLEHTPDYSLYSVSLMTLPSAQGNAGLLTERTGCQEKEKSA